MRRRNSSLVHVSRQHKQRSQFSVRYVAASSANICTSTPRGENHLKQARKLLANEVSLLLGFFFGISNLLYRCKTPKRGQKRGDGNAACVATPSLFFLSSTHILYSTFLFLLPLVELAMIMDRLYGGVCYAGIDTDPELKYPKGAGRVAFSNQQSYIAAISARFVQLQHGDIDKRVSLYFVIASPHIFPA